eukprot:GFUD01037137.1.p1 GENE.GFUD01037137.1~~GFUD01037137.1.p1  ORF type:complete len:247 (+),score=69.06 GFUD01037137.1:358-1098(+)
MTMKKSEKDNDPLVPTHHPLTRTGCCPCCSPRCLVLLVGVLSLLVSLVVLLPSLYMLVWLEGWQVVRSACHEWLEKNHWDIKVTRAVWRGFDWVDMNHSVILSGVVGSSVVHLLFSFMLVLGAILYKRGLFIPWMVSDMIIIIIMVVTFTCWTFMSFFVDLLVAIVFPVVAGLMLGFCIYLWRRVLSIFIQLGRREMGKITVRQQAGYKQVPHRKISAGDDLGDQMVRRPHRQLLMVVEDEKALQI